MRHVIPIMAIDGDLFALQRIRGRLSFPFARRLGVPANESFETGRLLGLKLAALELLATSSLRSWVRADGKEEAGVNPALRGFASVLLLGSHGRWHQRPCSRAARGHGALSAPQSLLAGTLLAMLTGSIAGITG